MTARDPAKPGPTGRSLPAGPGGSTLCGAAVRHGLVAAVAAIVAALPSRSVAQPPAAADSADVLVTVGEERISRGDLNRVLELQGAAALPEGAARTQATRLALEKLVDERLLRGEIDRRKITATESEVDRAVAQLAAQGKLREAAVDATVRRQVALDLCLRKMILPEFDEAERSRILERHRREIDGTKVRVSHILLRPDAGRGADAVPDALRRAAEIRTRIVDGDMSFAEAAARFSAGPSRHRGGDLGFTARSGLHHEAVAAAAYAVSEGEVSPPVVSPFGVHLVTVTAIEPGTADPRSLAPRIEQIWARQAIADLVARLRKTTPVVYAAGVPSPEDAASGDGARPPRPAAGE